MKGFNWLDSSTRQNIFTIEGYSKGKIQDATIQLKNLGQKVNFVPKIKKNQPIMLIEIETDAKIIMLVGTNQNNFEEIMELVEKGRVNIIKVEAGDILQIDKFVKFKVFNPEQELTDDINDN